jgi:hypothetical protein
MRHDIPLKHLETLFEKLSPYLATDHIGGSFGPIFWMPEEIKDKANGIPNAPVHFYRITFNQFLYHYETTWKNAGGLFIKDFEWRIV